MCIQLRGSRAGFVVRKTTPFQLVLKQCRCEFCACAGQVDVFHSPKEHLRCMYSITNVSTPHQPGSLSRKKDQNSDFTISKESIVHTFTVCCQFEHNSTFDIKKKITSYNPLQLFFILLTPGHLPNKCHKLQSHQVAPLTAAHSRTQELLCQWSPVTS